MAAKSRQNVSKNARKITVRKLLKRVHLKESQSSRRPHFNPIDFDDELKDSSQDIMEQESKPLIIPCNIKKIEANSMGFKFCSEIIIEEGVEEIESWAFTCCSVKGATIPSSVRKIGANPFPHTHIFNVTCKSPYYTIKDDILIENETMRLVSYVGRDKRSEISSACWWGKP